MHEHGGVFCKNYSSLINSKIVQKKIGTRAGLNRKPNKEGKKEGRKATHHGTRPAGSGQEELGLARETCPGAVSERSTGAACARTTRDRGAVLLCSTGSRCGSAEDSGERGEQQDGRGEALGTRSC